MSESDARQLIAAESKRLQLPVADPIRGGAEFERLVDAVWRSDETHRCARARRCCRLPLAAAPPADFDARVESLRAKIGVPGLAIAIVENGEATLARGYGVSKFGASDRVDADTIFPTGSTGKAFTVAALATLVDAGKIGWDDKVTDRLPGFQMYDPWVTREMTIRDLLVHRSGLGLGAGDLMMVPRGSSRAPRQ